MTVTMEVVTKSVEASVQDVDSENPNGDFVVILSKDNLDRDDENLWAYEWLEPLPSKIHMDTDHAFAKGMSVPMTAGSGVPEISEDGDLLVKGGYAGTAHGQLTRQLVKEGHIWQASVSYQLKELPDGRIVRELLNGTFTGVPCNPEAVVLSSKSTDTRTYTYRDDVQGKADAPLTPGTHHADPGYLDRNGDPAKGGNGVPRYQLDDAAHVRNALARFAQNATSAKYTTSQRSAILGRIRSAARKFNIDVSDKGGDKALVIALCKAITTTKDAPIATLGEDAGARSVYDPSDDEDHAEDDEENMDVAQAIHDAAKALGAECKHEEHATLSSLEASLKSIVQPVIRGYTITVAGPPGLEMFTLNKGDAVIGHGKLEDLTGTAATKDLQSDADDDPAALAAALDATLDQAVALLRGADLSSLPTNVAQAYALACAAETTVDELLKVMNVYDADDADEASEPGDSDSDDNPSALAGSLDALLDEAGTLINGVDLSALPENAAKMCALLVAAETIVDELLDAMGVYDPSDSATVKSKSVHADVNSATDGATKPPEQAVAASGATAEEIESVNEGEQTKAVTVQDEDTPVTVVAEDDPETLPQSTDETVTAAAETKAAAATTSPADLAARAAAKARLRNFQFNNDTTLIENETLETETE